jgi:hypothetical protein
VFLLINSIDLKIYLDSNKMDDYEMEQFYIGFRDSMKNFYNQHSFTRPLSSWSDKLNLLQSRKQFTEIRETIIKIISLYATDLMRTDDGYNACILETNIKRWNKITGENISNSNIVFVLFNIFISLIKRGKELPNYSYLFYQVELYLLYEDFTGLIEYSVTNNVPSITDKLLKFKPEIISSITEMYDLDKQPGRISSKKLFQLISEKNQ